MEETSLDDFLDAAAGDAAASESDAGEKPTSAAGTEDGGAAETEDGDAAGTSATADEVGPPSDAVEPALPTYDWSTDESACAICGEATRRRWSDDEGLVCADCKEW